MKRRLCAMIFGVTIFGMTTFGVIICGVLLLPGYAQQQDTRQRPDNAGQTGTVTPIGTPSAAPSPSTASSMPSTPATVPPAAPDEATAVDSALQAQIQDALNRDPIFSRSTVRVTATPDGIELSGDVPSGRERLSAVRIAQSYARGKKVQNHIVVKEHSPAGSNVPEIPPVNSAGSPASPESGNGSPPRF